MFDPAIFDPAIFDTGYGISPPVAEQPLPIPTRRRDDALLTDVYNYLKAKRGV